ncbi:hypothetical protein [Defluviicoccus vanus]|uniref:DUF4062 domain-containing protein n=1 Tax=Defluviicoccus vanus TaxID=111831 RepID=A0A7H1N0W9_9PROT|nr:hypothetical protein [Defluviicoccus vanus]QNT69355.1 hypothetical protein HQ394_08535 [Defluviicoccus vanus]
MDQRVIKVFMSSPSDVPDERRTIAQLVAEINDMLEYLGPRDTPLKLQLLRYETDTYPDYGQPQAVVNRQMDDDFHIFIGIMWARCGTRTAHAESGTIEEFDRALERRKQSNLPRLMFYFCDEPMPIPDLEGVAQLEKVVKFRHRLASEGLTGRYATHADFRDVVRGGLLRAIHDIIENKDSLKQVGQVDRSEALGEADRKGMLDLAANYDKLRRDNEGGSARTSLMAALFSKMNGRAASVRPMLAELQVSPSPGERLAAIAILQMFPASEHLMWLAERLDPDLERPFVGFQAAVALRHAVQILPASLCTLMQSAIHTASELGNRNPDDKPRLKVLEAAQHDLELKCAAATTARLPNATTAPVAADGNAAAPTPVAAN